MGEHPRFWVSFGIMLLAFAFFTAMSVYMVTAAHAQQQAQCPIYQDLKKALLENANELPSGSGITAKGNAAVIVFASPGGATWTIAIIGADGRACPVASGENWLDVIPPKAPVPGERPA
ncbi:MAG: hypothetical protein E5Y67_12285 [Mesorhizobium sp.]|uniref:hypothetical protein n=1 Tax=Mesorhizobium sp. TaxID=1871066 RepID=UPI00120ED926|nr:hypothetical protein [Mesorhizobium sp.]TIM14451.1 MAG: hypothetical protein E5Y67_12285 [Mesorhizobium sp.]